MWPDEPPTGQSAPQPFSPTWCLGTTKLVVGVVSPGRGQRPTEVIRSSETADPATPFSLALSPALQALGLADNASTSTASISPLSADRDLKLTWQYQHPQPLRGGTLTVN